MTFNAAHKLYVDSWSEEKNRATFGKCSNANWHGHNYQLFVTVKGEPHPDTGFVMDAKKLADILKNAIVDELDHRNLSLDVSWLKGVQPTTENVAIRIWERLEPLIENCELHCVKLVETENIFVEYYG